VGSDRLAAIDWAVLGRRSLRSRLRRWRTSGVRDADSYVRGDALRWPTIGLGIMRPASAITFLSLPGQAYADACGSAVLPSACRLATILTLRGVRAGLPRLRVRNRLRVLEHRFDLRAGCSRPAVPDRPRLARDHESTRRRSSCRQILGWPLTRRSGASAPLVVLYVLSAAAARSA